MINYKGYYVGAPSFYKDYAPGGIEMKGVLYNAFLFMPDGIVKRTIRRLKKIGSVDFKENDFKNAYSGKYDVDENFVTIFFDKDKNWELREVFEITGDQLLCRETNASEGLNRTFQFCQW